MLLAFALGILRRHSEANQPIWGLISTTWCIRFNPQSVSVPARLSYKPPGAPTLVQSNPLSSFPPGESAPWSQLVSPLSTDRTVLAFVSEGTKGVCADWAHCLQSMDQGGPSNQHSSIATQQFQSSYKSEEWFFWRALTYPTLSQSSDFHPDLHRVSAPSGDILPGGQFSIAFWPDHMAKLLVTTHAPSEKPKHRGKQMQIIAPWS